MRWIIGALDQLGIEENAFLNVILRGPEALQKSLPLDQIEPTETKKEEENVDADDEEENDYELAFHDEYEFECLGN